MLFASLLPYGWAKIPLSVLSQMGRLSERLWTIKPFVKGLCCHQVTCPPALRPHTNLILPFKPATLSSDRSSWRSHVPLHQWVCTVQVRHRTTFLVFTRPNSHSRNYRINATKAAHATIIIWRIVPMSPDILVDYKHQTDRQKAAKASEIFLPDSAQAEHCLWDQFSLFPNFR